MVRELFTKSRDDDESMPIGSILANCYVCCLPTAQLFFIILGTIYRFSYSGRLCSSEFSSSASHLPSAGHFLKVYLLLCYSAIGLSCLTGCIAGPLSLHDSDF